MDLHLDGKKAVARVADKGVGSLYLIVAGGTEGVRGAGMSHGNNWTK
jgi:hypothetical protein